MAPGTRLWLYSGVFFAFGSVGAFVCMLAFKSPPGWPTGMLAMALGGLLAIGWAAAFAERWWWLLLVVAPLSPVLHSWVFERMYAAEGWTRRFLEFGRDASPERRMAILCVMGIVTVFIGYFLTIRVARRIESGTARLRAELDVARAVHETLVPEVDARVGAAHVLGVSRASTEMGGDLIDLIPRTDGGADVIIADVAGHGVGAGIAMGMLKSSVRTILRRPVGLAELLSELNAVLSQLLRPGTFATAAVVRLGPDNRAEYALAGHLPILRRRLDGSVESLANEALPLAVEAAETFAIGSVTLEPGETLLLFTDGLIEVQALNGRQLGLAAFTQAFSQSSAGDPRSIAPALFELARAHGPQTDDQSLVVIRV